MGYKMSKQKALGYSPYFFMFGRDLNFQSKLQHLQNAELDLHTTEEWLQIFPEQQGQTFTRVMPMAMRNLAIAQKRDKERCWLVREGGLGPPKGVL